VLEESREIHDKSCKVQFHNKFAVVRKWFKGCCDVYGVVADVDVVVVFVVADV